MGECLLAQQKELDTQKDVQSLGLLLIEILEPDSVFLELPRLSLQRPDSIEPSAVDFLVCTRSSRADELISVRLLDACVRYTKLTIDSMNS